MSKYKIIMTGGGSAGHVTPNLALVPKLKEEGYEIKYIGSIDGIEKKIIIEAGIEYYSIHSGKLRRYFDIKNFTDPFKVIKGIFEAKKIIKKEKPDIVFSKGGFVSVPVVIGAHLNKVPVIAHECDMTPGLANKLASNYCDKVCVTFEETLKYIKGDKGYLTGLPIREELLKGSREEALKLCNFKVSKPILLIIGGSLGSKCINDTVRNSLDKLLIDFNIIHICGKGNLDNSINKKDGYLQFEYIDSELKHFMKASDYVISRAGANVIFELLALRKPNILIPLSKKASRGDQILNANSFKKNGYSIVIEEESLNEKLLLESLDKLKLDKNKYIDNMVNSKSKDAVASIISLIKEYTTKKR